jgi:hypothetical protein
MSILTRGLAAVCVGIILGECYVRATDPHISRIKRSYHIKRNDIYVWPPSPYGVYCTNYKEAQNKYYENLQMSPHAHYKLVSNPAIVSGGLLFPTVIGIVDKDFKIHIENNS